MKRVIRPTGSSRSIQADRAWPWPGGLPRPSRADNFSGTRGGWNRETTESRCILARENRGSFLAVYTARVRITVQADDVSIIREGHGSGEGRGASPGEAHDTALKGAETDATKRALATFGKPFGLALYGGTSHRRSGKTECCPLRLQAGCALAFIPMTRPLFQDRPDITAVANTLH